MEIAFSVPNLEDKTKETVKEAFNKLIDKTKKGEEGGWYKVNKNLVLERGEFTFWLFLMGNKSASLALRIGSTKVAHMFGPSLVSLYWNQWNKMEKEIIESNIDSLVLTINQDPIR